MVVSSKNGMGECEPNTYAERVSKLWRWKGLSFSLHVQLWQWPKGSKTGRGRRRKGEGFCDKMLGCQDNLSLADRFILVHFLYLISGSFRGGGLGRGRWTDSIVQREYYGSGGGGGVLLLSLFCCCSVGWRLVDKLVGWVPPLTPIPILLLL